MEYTLPVTLGGLVALVVVGVGGLLASDLMQTRTVLTMVAPSMLAFGLVAYWLGLKHGEFRAAD